MAEASEKRLEDLDPAIQRLLKLLSLNRTPAGSGIEARRRSLSHLMELGREISTVSVSSRDITIPGPTALAARIYSPPSPLCTLIYLHGGGLVAGSLATHDTVARSLAASIPAQVLAVDYRLAPEHPFPAALDDACRSIEFVRRHGQTLGLDPNRLGVCGDSAGAALCAAACRKIARTSGAALAFQLLLCPILDFSPAAFKDPALLAGPIVNRPLLEADLAWYLPPGTAADHPEVSPLIEEDLGGVPRTFVHVAEFDPLADQGRRYAARLEARGIDVSFTCHRGMIHLFYGLGGLIPYAKQAFAQIRSELDSALR
jgi:acetyl esterase/lipase